MKYLKTYKLFENSSNKVFLTDEVSNEISSYLDSVGMNDMFHASGVPTDDPYSNYLPGELNKTLLNNIMTMNFSRFKEFLVKTYFRGLDSEEFASISDDMQDKINGVLLNHGLLRQRQLEKTDIVEYLKFLLALDEYSKENGNKFRLSPNTFTNFLAFMEHTRTGDNQEKQQKVEEMRGITTEYMESYGYPLPSWLSEMN